MIPKNGYNGYVKWAALVPLLLALTAACMGATWKLLDKQEQGLYTVIKIMQVDLREVRNDVKDLLRKGG